MLKQKVWDFEFGYWNLFDICDLEFAALSYHYLQNLNMGTIRQQIIELLSAGEMDARELSREVGVKEKDVYAHLAHIARSQAARGRKLAIRASECLSCGYVFKDRRRFTRPGRCPRCRESQITSPFYHITCK